MFESLQLLGAPDLPGAALAQAQAAEAAQEAAEEREAAATQARYAERAEALALQNRSLGDPIGGIRQAQAKLADCQDMVDELSEQLRRAEALRDSARSSVAFWSDRLLIVEESTRRSRTLSPV